MSRFVPVLGREGDIWQGPDDLIDELEEFTCALYGNLRTTSVNELSCVTWYCHIFSDTAASTSVYPRCLKSIDFESLEIVSYC